MYLPKYLVIFFSIFSVFISLFLDEIYIIGKKYVDSTVSSISI